MKGKPPLTAQHQHALPASQWSSGLGKSLREGEVLHREAGEKAGHPWEIRRTPSCVWVILPGTRFFQLGIRAVFCPTGLQEVRMRKATETSFEFTANGGLGHYHVKGEFLEGLPFMLRVTTTLKPDEDIRITAAPRDLCGFDRHLNPYHGEGRLFTCQTGNTAGQAFFSALEKKGATVFYFQNLSGLADYFTRTGAKPGGCVGGEWPEAGFKLPQGEKPMPQGVSMVIADAFVAVKAGILKREAEAAQLFLDSLARLYPLLPQPRWSFDDWPARAASTLRSLTTGKGCTRQRWMRKPMPKPTWAPPTSRPKAWFRARSSCRCWNTPSGAAVQSCRCWSGSAMRRTVFTIPG